MTMALRFAVRKLNARHNRRYTLLSSSFDVLFTTSLTFVRFFFFPPLPSSITARASSFSTSVTVIIVCFYLSVSIATQPAAVTILIHIQSIYGCVHEAILTNRPSVASRRYQSWWDVVESSHTRSSVASW